MLTKLLGQESEPLTLQYKLFEGIRKIQGKIQQKGTVTSKELAKDKGLNQLLEEISSSQTQASVGVDQNKPEDLRETGKPFQTFITNPLSGSI